METRRKISMEPVVMRVRQPARTKSAKTRNRRMQNKCSGTPTKPRLSVFCSDKQLYVMLVDDQNKKCLFYGSTLQKSIRQDPNCSTADTAKLVGEELIQVCNDLTNFHRREANERLSKNSRRIENEVFIGEISPYDRNGFSTGKGFKHLRLKFQNVGYCLDKLQLFLCALVVILELSSSIAI